MRESHAFLAQFKIKDRSTISNHFLEPIRRAKGQGRTLTPRAVVDLVLKEEARLMEYPSSLRRSELFIAIIGEFEEDALSYARERIAYVDLSDAEREEIKTENAREGWRLYEQAKPPEERAPITERQRGYLPEERAPITERQRGYLLRIGVDPANLPPDKATASRMIDERVREEKNLP